MEAILDGIITGVINTSLLEWIAVTCGIASVIFSMRENILVYPTGIVSVLIYIYITIQFKLYADMGVNAYYFVMSVYGWYYWTNTDGSKEQVPVTVNSVIEHIYSLIILISSFGILSYVLINFTDSDVPLWDATTTAFAITGMWLMARKKLENWIAWIITDLISIPLYFYKGLVLTSFQFLVFTILAVMGLIAWKKSYDQTQSSSK